MQTEEQLLRCMGRAGGTSTPPRMSLSRNASDLERLGHWEEAARLWAAAARVASGENVAWCEARMEWCRHRALSGIPSDATGSTGG
ncbi:ANR family transcriptional regulator [Salmonella enterica]|nr:ANR family transcriptional regulator [Salmonella enterica]